MEKVFKVEFSTRHEFDFGVRYQTKLVSNKSDELLGIDSKETYYVWGTKELTGEITLNPDDYNIKEEEYTVVDKETGDPILIKSNRITGLK